VAEHGRDRVLGPQRHVQQLVAADRGPQRPGVVAQLADLGGGLVDEGQVPVGRADGAGAEQRVGGALLQQPRHPWAGEVEPVAPDQHVDAGRVAAPHLEPVERRQRLLDRRVPLDGGPPGLAAGQVGDGAGRARAVLGDGPHGVLQPDHRGVGPLERGDVVDPVAGRRAGARVEPGFDGPEGLRQRGGQPLDLDQQPPVEDQRADAVGAAQHPVDRFDVLGRRGAGLGEWGRSRQGGHRTVEGGRDGVRIEGYASPAAADDGDDPAHPIESTNCPTP
jgi:hypothetical protein